MSSTLGDDLEDAKDKNSRKDKLYEDLMNIQALWVSI